MAGSEYRVVNIGGSDNSQTQKNTERSCVRVVFVSSCQAGISREGA